MFKRPPDFTSLTVKTLETPSKHLSTWSAPGFFLDFIGTVLPVFFPIYMDTINVHTWMRCAYTCLDNYVSGTYPVTYASIYLILSVYSYVVYVRRFIMIYLCAHARMYVRVYVWMHVGKLMFVRKLTSVRKLMHIQVYAD